jgi:Trk K+ transport system NAD-binding subunit
MPFSADERTWVLAVKGLGPTVIKRLEEMGISSFDTLTSVTSQDVTARAAAMLGAQCWKNSPQARAAIDAAIACATEAGKRGA